uniref:Uncharacterized protein n=1 Tax=Cyclophora tenuis TaxID=216820 RepID=A0A7S1GP08_CYCTE|mmetsp:Transcript_9012/g.15106  ORF Transcript_9012/g.15106 Transcript_9012/m.15106 type:complete len:304 (+) Transcript_9012:55-966(+)
MLCRTWISSAVATAELLYVTGSIAASLIPRPDLNDRSLLGGGLTRPFRLALVWSLVLNFLRYAFLQDLRFTNCDEADEQVQQQGATDAFLHCTNRRSLNTLLYHLDKAVESCLLSFLQLLVPYLVQVKLKDYIHILPGRGLKMWLTCILLLNCAGVIAVQFDKRLWLIKKLGDALSSIPIIHSLGLYKRIVTHPANLSSANAQNLIFIHTVLVVEYWGLTVGALSCTGVVMDDAKSPIGVHWWLGFRITNIFTAHLRVFIHAIMLNMIDQAQFNEPQDPQPGNEDEATSRYSSEGRMVIPHKI